VTIDSYAGSPADTETNTSPFAGMSYVEAPVLDNEFGPVESGESPFDSFYTTDFSFGEDVSTETDAEAELCRLRPHDVV